MLAFTSPTLATKSLIMRSKGASARFYFVLPLTWTFVVMGLMLSPGAAFPSSQITGITIVVHFVVFGIWAFLANQAFYKQPQWPVLKFYRGFYVLVLGIIVVAGVEVIQGFLLWSRSAELGDYIAGILGLLGGLLIFERLVLSAKSR